MKTFDDEWAQIVSHYWSDEHQRTIKRAQQMLLEKPVALYGAGAEGVEFADILTLSRCPPVCFCDKNKSGTEPHTGLPIISPGKLLGPYKDANILISSAMYCEEIKHDLDGLGVSRDRLLPRSLLTILLPWLCSEGTAAYGSDWKRHHYLMLFHDLSRMIAGKDDALLAGCRQTYDWLCDEASKKAFLDYLKLCFIAAPVKALPIHTQYFDPVVELSDKEVFVDCGAYTGDTAEAFMRRVNGRYVHYFAFEPDADNYQAASAFFQEKPAATLIPKGLWSCDTKLCFEEGSSSSSAIMAEGRSVVEVTSIDRYFSDKEQVPTMIKMDIEGSELEALKGAEHTIRQHRPKLAICIYHRAQDLYELPQFIKSCRSDYKLYIRHYTDTFTELVLYAV